MRLKKLVRVAVCAGALLFASGSSMAVEKITLNDNPYPSFQAIMNLLIVLFEERLGYQVETKPADNAVTYAGMHAGKGDIDIHCDAWIPNQKDFHKKYVLEEKTVAYSDKHYIGSSGFCVPGYFAEEHNVKTIYDLARPEVAKLLDTDGNGKGEIWIGRTGWIATNENMIKTRDYGLLGNNEWVRVTPGAHYGALKEAIKNKKGYAGYCWKPDWVWDAFGMVQLEEPENDGKGCWKQVTQKEDPDWFKNSKITCASAPKTIQFAWSKALEARAPLATQLLANIQLDIDTVTRWAYEVGAEKRDPREVVSKWIAANPKRVDGWFGM